MTAAARLPAEVRPIGRNGRSVLSYSLLALVVVADQMLLPMLHVAGIPFKPSYLILALALLPRSLETVYGARQQARVNDDWRLAAAIAVIIAAGLVGELWLSLQLMVVAHGEALRSTLIYVLAALAFILGQRAIRFRFEWLVHVLFIAVALNFAFIVLQHRLPGWLTAFYYPEPIGGLTVFEFLRPRGLFGNPNVSALMVNILVLFINLALRKRLLVVTSLGAGLGIIALPILLSAVLATRGEFLVALLLGFLNYRLLFKGNSYRRTQVRRIALAAGLAILVALGASQLSRSAVLADGMTRITELARIAVDVEARVSRQGGIGRPLLTLEYARDRFVRSPVVGTGFGHGDRYPFDLETVYFHNDWFRLFVTSGLVGAAAMLWLLWRFAWPLGWPVMVPFILPGIVNTFMLSIPAFIFYFLMLGVLRQQLIQRSTVAVAGNAVPVDQLDGVSGS